MSYMSETKLIPIGLIVEPPEPMRLGFDEEKLDDLAQDIRTRGLLNPLTVYPELVCDCEIQTIEHKCDKPRTRQTGRYKIAAGHRRFLACRMVGVREVLCTIREGTADDYEADMIAENMFREELTPFEEGNRFKEISVREGMTEERMRRLCGNKSLPYIYSRIQLVEGDPEIALAVHNKKITLGVAAELNKVSTDWHRLKGRTYTDEQWAELERHTLAHRRYLLALACDTGTTKPQAHSWVVQWEMQEGIAPPPPTEPLTTAHAPMPEGFVLQCALCGQTERPYDIEHIAVCRNEWRAIKVAYAQTDTAG